LVKWAGYPDSENSWIRAADILDPVLIREFNARTKEGTPAVASPATKAATTPTSGKKKQKRPAAQVEQSESIAPPSKQQNTEAQDSVRIVIKLLLAANIPSGSVRSYRRQQC